MATPADSDLPRVQRQEPPPPTLWESAAVYVSYAANAFLTDIIIVGDTPLRAYLPEWAKRWEPHDKTSEDGQRWGDWAAFLLGSKEFTSGGGLFCTAVGVEGFLAAAPGGQLAPVGAAPVAVPAALVGLGLGSLGVATMGVAGRHLAKPPKYKNQDQGLLGGGSQSQGAKGGPAEPYDRTKHYGRTPTKGDREAMGAGEKEVLDHEPPLVKRYYEGDPARGEPPGHQLSPAERKASGADRTRMSRQPRAESDSQGGKMAQYSKKKKRELFEQKEPSEQ